MENNSNNVNIICWNVNSIKACIRRLNLKNLEELLTFLNSPDIACFQETKLTKNELDESLACPPSYDAFYSFSRRTKHKAGYSGTVTLVKKKSLINTIDAEDGITGIWTPSPNQNSNNKNVNNNNINNTMSSTPSIGNNINVFNDFPIDNDVMKDIDSEGRCVITDHEKFVILNLYCPALTVDIDEEPEKYEERKKFKLYFLNMVSHRSQSLIHSGRNVIICGDLNCSTGNPLDYAWNDEDDKKKRKYKKNDNNNNSHDDNDDNNVIINNVNDNNANAATKNFSESTLWLLEMLEDKNIFTDTFRYMNPELRKYSCWSMKTSARKNNYGSRIDYFLTGPTNNFTKKCVIASNVLDTIEGSDHAPIELKLSLQFDGNIMKPVPVLPSLCAANYKKFSGQKKMDHFMVKNNHNHSNSLFSKHMINRGSSMKKGKPKQKSLFDLGLMKTRTTSSLSSKNNLKRNSSNIKYDNNNNNNGKITLSRIVKKPRYNDDVITNNNNNNNINSSSSHPDVKKTWKTMLNGKGKTVNAPLCKCGIKTVLRISNTAKSKGKRFYVCANPPGEKGKEGSRCNFFCWATVRGKPIVKKKKKK